MPARAHRPAPRRHGFTLIELGIVIGVTAILAAAIVPDIIETMRNRMAEKAAADVIALHDSARLFFVQNTNRAKRWPGETSAGQCNLGWTFENFKVDMVGGGYLATGSGPANPFAGIASNFMQNPWSNTYEVSLYAPNTATTPACLFGVSTLVPASVANSFIAYLPQATCGAGCPGTAPNPGWARCCSFAAKPSAALLSVCAGKTITRGAGGALLCN